MIDKIKQFFNSHIEHSESPSGDPIQLAAAALLMEVMVIDHQLDKAEEREIQRLLENLFGLNGDELLTLYDLAQAEHQEGTSLYQFTRLINDHFSPEDKFQLVVNLWRVAYADGHLDKYEEGVIRKISDLLYVSHSDFIRSKHFVLQQG